MFPNGGSKTSPPARAPRALLALVLALAFPLAGCGATVIDDEKSEDTLRVSLEESFERQISAVDCPSDQEVEPGAIFKCSVRFADGERATAVLEIRNEDADVDLVDIEANE